MLTAAFFQAIFTIRALRDSRYHNTAYAIAELIDNSIEADAEQIDLLCMEKTSEGGNAAKATGYRSWCPRQRNGHGRKYAFSTPSNSAAAPDTHLLRESANTVWASPTSSMSQCKRVDVWTWQAGLTSAWHSSIDAESIERGDHLVPLPDQQTPLPDAWLRAGSNSIYQHSSGTLVVWSKLDKIQWKTGRTIVDNTGREVGANPQTLD